MTPVPAGGSWNDLTCCVRFACGDAAATLIASCLLSSVIAALVAHELLQLPVLTIKHQR